MKIQIERNDLLNLLQKTQNIIEKRNTMPILSNALLVADSGKLTIFATDLEVSIKDHCPAKIETEGKVAVSAKSLFDLAKELGESTVHLSKKNNNWLEIKNEKAVFNIVCSPAEEFPAFPNDEPKELLKVQSPVLLDMIEKTIYSVSNDETRYHLNGVYFERVPTDKGASFRMVATDGHRLSLIDKQLEIPLNLKKAEGVIIPKKGLFELRKILEGGDSGVEMGFEGSHLVVRRDNTVLLIRLIDGKYPNYQQLIPQRLQRRVGVSREGLLSSLRRVSLLSNQKSKGITISLSKNAMEIYSNNPEIGDAKEELDVQYA
ncbi:MAG: DNA polymerase III subunit beta, partial [Oligoflexia bacterium]|nr:DNA polymerase III subunit beta [Oligoflexia bacterium]